MANDISTTKRGGSAGGSDFHGIRDTHRLQVVYYAPAVPRHAEEETAENFASTRKIGGRVLRRGAGENGVLMHTDEISIKVSYKVLSASGARRGGGEVGKERDGQFLRGLRARKLRLHRETDTWDPSGWDAREGSHLFQGKAYDSTCVSEFRDKRERAHPPSPYLSLSFPLGVIKEKRSAFDYSIPLRRRFPLKTVECRQGDGRVSERKNIKLCDI